MAKDLLSILPRLHIAPAKVTKEKLVNLCMQAIKMDPEIESLAHTSFNCFLDEISTFLPPHDIEFAITLADLYDCPEHWQYSLISRNDTILDHVYLTIIGGITPKMVAESLGQRSLGLGFTSRVVFVYSEDVTRQPLFPTGDPPDISFLQDDLIKVHELRGPYTITVEAATTLKAWYDAGMPPAPNDSRFSEYIPRRHIHLIKLAMLVAAGRRDKREITLEDYEFAKAMLLEAEETMPIALEEVGQNPMIDAMKRTQRWALIEFRTNGRQPFHESVIRRRLLTGGIQSNYLEQTLQAMLTSGYFHHVGGTYPNRVLEPGEPGRD